MKKLKLIKKISDGFLKKYLLDYDIGEGESYQYELASRNDIKSISELGKGKENAVCIVPIYSDGSLCVCKEWRYAINDYLYEFPAGLIDDGETVEMAAGRELKEETGLDLVKVLKVYPAAYSSAGMTDEKVAIVLCLVDGEITGSRGKEEIFPMKMSLNDALLLIQDETKQISSRFQCLMINLDLILNDVTAK